MIVSMSVELYVICGCGFRVIEKMMNYLNQRFEWNLEDIPSHVSIKNWVEKCGYCSYQSPSLENYQGDYAQIVDESMMIGSEKLLLSLGIKADKTQPCALQLKDVEVLDISVKKSWNSTQIADVFTRTQQKLKRPPAYVISDNASTISKAIKDKSYSHIKDVSHTLAMFVEREYKDDTAFNDFTKALSTVKSKEVMRPTSYLLPPKQRTIARFMNLSQSLTWSTKLLNSFNRLNKEEQKVFGFIRDHLPLIQDLTDIFDKTDRISTILKNEGICYKTIARCKQLVKPLFQSDSQKAVAVAANIIRYLQELRGKLTNKETSWHASSDIIESIFGKYKDRKSTNSLNGVTRFVLILPLLTKIDLGNRNSTICFKSALESVFLKDLTQWAKDNLTENMAVKRRKILKFA